MEDGWIAQSLLAFQYAFEHTRRGTRMICLSTSVLARTAQAPDDRYKTIQSYLARCSDDGANGSEKARDSQI